MSESIRDRLSSCDIPSYSCTCSEDSLHVLSEDLLPVALAGPCPIRAGPTVGPGRPAGSHVMGRHGSHMGAAIATRGLLFHTPQNTTTWHNCYHSSCPLPCMLVVLAACAVCALCVVVLCKPSPRPRGGSSRRIRADWGLGRALATGAEKGRGARAERAE